MKKIIKISLFLLFVMIINTRIVIAKTYNDTFYAGEYITGEYIKKEKTNFTAYKQHRFINRTSDKKAVYCISPWDNMNEGQIYIGYDEDYLNKTALSKTVWDKIRLISYYGYGYGNHTAKKWYTITQMMIWKEVDKNSKFSWTDKLSGETITKYETEMKEINNLIANHMTLPAYANKTYYTSINQAFSLIDNKFSLNDFKITANIKNTKSSNSVSIDTSARGNYILNFNNIDTKYDSNPIVYISNNSQNILAVGNNDPISFKVNISVESGTLKARLLDKETKSNTPRGAATLKESEYNLYDRNGTLIDTIAVDDNIEIKYNNLGYGEYCLQQEKSGVGYIIDTEKHCFSIDHENLDINLDLYNEIIKEKIILTKYKKNNNEEKALVESNISFKIVGINHPYEEVLTTNENGIIEVTLIYGKYLFHQLNSTDKYLKVDDFIVEADGTNDEYKYNLIDHEEPSKESKEKIIIATKQTNNINPNNISTYKVFVPNTSAYTKKNNFSTLLLSIIALVTIKIYVKVKENTINIR